MNALLTRFASSDTRLSPERRRLVLVLIAGITVAVAVMAAVQLAAAAWTVDIQRNLGASQDLLDGRFGRDRGYLYSPFGALALVPLTWLPPPLAVAAWLGGGVALIAAGVARTTGRLPMVDRALVAVTAVAFVPTLYDLMLGNVTVALLAGVALIAWRRDEARNGILLGVLLAAAPKPGLIPVLVWIALFRRRSMGGVLLGSSIATAVTVALFGLAPYVAWVDVLRAPDYLSSTMAGNLALSSLPMPWELVCSLAAILAAAWAVRRGPWPALLAAICVGLLVAPYTLAYSGVLLLAIVPALAIASPLATMAIGTTASVLAIAAFPLWVALLMGVAVLLPSRRWPASPPVWRPESRHASDLVSVD